MRRLVLASGVFVVACGGGDSAGLEVAESACLAGRFHYVHDVALGDGVAGGEGDLGVAGVSFVNAGIDNNNGSLEIGDLGGGGTQIKIEFADLLPDGGTVDARGTVKLDLQGIHVGNCETAELSGRLTEIGNGWKFTLVDLHASPFCSGAALSGSFAGCTRTSQ